MDGTAYLARITVRPIFREAERKQPHDSLANRVVISEIRITT